MHFIDDIDFIPPFRGRIGDVFHDAPHVVHAVVGCRIHLDHIHPRAGEDIFTGSAFPAGTAIHGTFTVHRSGQYFGDGSLAGSPGSRKQIGMSDPIRLYLVFQGFHNMLLSFHILKAERAKFTVECCI